MDGSCSNDRRISQHGFENSHHFQLGTANFLSAARDVHNYNISAPPGDGDKTEDKLIERVCEWLTKVNFGSIYSESHSKATEGTGMWFTKSKEFDHWKRGDSKILWGTGKPGAGKTTLSSIVIQHLQRDDDAAHRAPVIFAFCRYMEKYSPSEVFASWIQQLLRRDQSTLEHVRESFRIHERDNSRPSEIELHQLMSAVVQDFDRVFIVLDGLDEAEEDTRKPLLDFINTLPSNTHALIMSRPLGSLQHLFPCAVQVDIEARNEDIQRFVEKRILDIPSLHAVLLGRDAAKEELCTAIKRKSGGMFLIASLQIEALKSCISVQSLMKKLETLPIGLNELYDHTLERIEAQGQEKTSLAKRVLLWVTYALRPMSIREVQEAVAIELDSKTFDANRMSPIELLLDVCCGLVALDASKQELLGSWRQGVRLIHYTTSDFLKARRPPWLDSNPHSTLSCFCTGYNSFPDISPFNNHFKKYACQTWHRHARLACKESGLPDRVREFLLSQSTAHEQRLPTPSWSRLWPDGWISRERHLSPEHLALLVGLQDYLLDHVQDSTVTSRHRFTFLHMAAIGGHVDTAEAIMEKWPSLSPMDQSAEGKTPIMLAAGCGQESMLKFLLSRTPNDGQALIARATCGCTALACAVGQNQKATIRLLLSRPGIDVNVTYCNTGLAPLARAALNRDEAMVRQILLNPNLNINALNPWTGYTALMQASGEHNLLGANVAIVELLMSHPDINVNLGPRCGCTPLIVATYHSRSENISKLLAHPHINLHARCNRAGTALSIAANQMALASHWTFRERYDSCSELMSTQERILRNADEDDVHRCLQIASSLGLRDMASELISKTKIRPKAVALVEAAKAGCASTVEMLLEHVDVNAEDSTGCTALSAAVMKGHSSIVDIFLARQDILVNKGSIPPLIQAIQCEKTEPRRPPIFSNFDQSSTNRRLLIARQLLRRSDIDINVLDSTGRVPLTCAMEANRWDIVDLLLSRPDVDLTLGEPPVLVQACLKGWEALVRKLLATDGLDVNAVDATGGSALSMAAYVGHGQIAELLVSRPNVNVNVGSPTALMHACHQGHTGIVDLLLSSRGEELDINLRAESYECRPTALWFACLSDRPNSDIIRLLLQRSDIDVNVGLTIGHAACKCANTLKPQRLIDHRQLPTPLHVAALQQKDAVPLLLASPRINVNALNMDGKTPFMLLLESTPFIRRPSPTDSFLSHPAILEESFGSRALISAATTGDHKEKKLNEIKTILSRGRIIDVNFVELNGRSALSTAASQASAEIVAFLLSFPSIDPNSGNPPPLAQASVCWQNHTVVQLLLEHPNIDLNRETDGYTALGGACMVQYLGSTTLNTIKLLLSQPKLDVNAGKPSPLSIAVQAGDIGVVKLLLEHPMIDANSLMQCVVQIPMWVKGKHSQIHVYRGEPWPFYLCSFGECCLLEVRGRQVDSFRWSSTGISYSCLDKKTDRISRPYATCNAHDPLRQKLRDRYEDVSQTAKPEGSGDPIFVYCTRFGSSQILELLLPRAEFDVNAPGSCGCTALIWACSLGKWAIVDTLLSRKDITVDARCPTHGHNALVATAHRMKFEMVHQLLSHPRGHEMDPNVIAACGCNLLVCASRSGDEDTVHSILPFIKYRDYLNAQDCRFGRTALQWASYFGHDSLIQLFLSEPSVSADHRDKRGNTALMLAASSGRYDAVQILLASPKVTNVHRDCNSNGDTALSLAEWYGHIDIARLLESVPLEQAAVPFTSDCAVPSSFRTTPFVSCNWITVFFAILSILFFSLIYFALRIDVLAFRVYG